ncbi:MAG: hypothetical protein AAFP84_21890, partial [Actinomycetota bacterium]
MRRGCGVLLGAAVGVTTIGVPGPVVVAQSAPLTVSFERRSVNLGDDLWELAFDPRGVLYGVGTTIGRTEPCDVFGSEVPGSSYVVEAPLECLEDYLVSGNGYEDFRGIVDYPDQEFLTDPAVLTGVPSAVQVATDLGASTRTVARQDPDPGWAADLTLFDPAGEYGCDSVRLGVPEPLTLVYEGPLLSCPERLRSIGFEPIAEAGDFSERFSDDGSRSTYLSFNGFNEQALQFSYDALGDDRRLLPPDSVVALSGDGNTYVIRVGFGSSTQLCFLDWVPDWVSQSPECLAVPNVGSEVYVSDDASALAVRQTAFSFLAGADRTSLQSYDGRLHTLSGNGRYAMAEISEEGLYRINLLTGSFDWVESTITDYGRDVGISDDGQLVFY